MYAAKAQKEELDQYSFVNYGCSVRMQIMWLHEADYMGPRQGVRWQQAMLPVDSALSKGGAPMEDRWGW
jgi:hypothetical protein